MEEKTLLTALDCGQRSPGENSGEWQAYVLPSLGLLALRLSGSPALRPSGPRPCGPVTCLPATAWPGLDWPGLAWTVLPDRIACPRRAPL
jgi:hypothetical protein